MKQFLLSFVFIALVSTLQSQPTITANAGAGLRWDVASSWDLNRIPTGGDLIVIPAGRTIEVRNPNTVSGASVRINIHGTLLFPTNGADKLDLPCGSTIQIYSGGLIHSTGGSNSDLINICGTTIWNSTTGPNPQGGPSHSNYPSYGFVSGTLPVIFQSVEVNLTNNNTVSIKWSTSFELNNSHFEIERSLANTWTTIASINSQGNSGSVQQYAFTDVLNQNQKGIILYRIRQVDLDGKSSFSSIKAINVSLSTSFIAFPNPVKETLHIYFDPNASQTDKILVLRNLSGQIIWQKNISRGESYATINTAQFAKGIHYISLNSESFSYIQKILIQ